MKQVKRVLLRPRRGLLPLLPLLLVLATLFWTVLPAALFVDESYYTYILGNTAPGYEHVVHLPARLPIALVTLHACAGSCRCILLLPFVSLPRCTESGLRMLLEFLVLSRVLLI